MQGHRAHLPSSLQTIFLFARLLTTNNTMSSSGYEPVPDVDSGVAASDGKTSAERAKEKYPEASDLEATFLGHLDDAIDNAEPTVAFPPVDPSEIGEADSPSGLLNALKLPMAALVVSIVLTFLVVWIHVGGLTHAYPYLSALLIFVASIPPTRGRFLKQTAPFFDKIDSIKDLIEGKIKELEEKALSYLTQAYDAFNKAIEPMRPKLDLATKAETMLRKIDPSIDIPDLSDIEKSFDGFEDQVKAAFAPVMDMIDITSLIPIPFQSRFQLEMYSLHPFFVVFFLLQLLVTWLSTSFLFGNPANANEWELISYSILSFLVAAAQVALAFFFTNVLMVVGHINAFLLKVTGSVNGSLDHATGPTFTSVFKDGFGSIRDKMLGLMAKMNKLEGPLGKVKMPELPGGLKVPKVPKVKVPGMPF